MRKARAIVHPGLPADDARRAVLALLSMGLDAEARRAPAAAADSWHVDIDEELEHASGHELHRSEAESTTAAAFGEVWQLTVAADEVAAALPLIEETLSPESRDAAARPAARLLDAPDGIWTLGNSRASLLLGTILVAVHLVVHGAQETTRSAMIDAGAVAPWLVRQGEWWRLASAAFLHFDVKHLVGNLSALCFLGPPLAAAIGQLRLALLFLATAVAGNVVSQMLGSEAAVKAGASGGVCGLLGALAGVAIASMARATDARERRPAWQTLGALVALFGMIVGFEPGRDHYAHVGGLLAGLALGRAISPPAPRPAA